MLDQPCRRILHAPTRALIADSNPQPDHPMAQATIKNQLKIMANQRAIVGNQVKIIRNQQAIIKNQKKIIAATRPRGRRK